MVKSKNNNISKIVMTGLSLIVVCFIWGNSLVKGDQSKGISSSVLDIVNRGISSLGLNIRFDQHMIRKTAHFTEHMVLGIILLLTLRTYTEEVLKNICNILFIGLLVPVIDEFIQLFVDGRGGEIKDVIIDYSGFLTGLIIISAIMYLIDKKRGRKKIGRHVKC